MKAAVRTLKYYRKRLYRVSVAITPLYTYHSHNAKRGGFQFFKCYEKRDLIGGDWKVINHVRINPYHY